MPDFSATAVRKSENSPYDVIVAGGGPTGMMLAAELALAGVETLLVERRPTPDLAGSRAGGLQSRSLEILDQRGVLDRFLAAGRTAQVNGFGWIKLDLSDFPTRHPYGLALWQNEIERLLAGWLDDLPVTVLRGAEVTGFRETDAGIEVDLADGRRLHSAWLVGCDGGRSRVRKMAGIAFPGTEPTTSNIIAEVQLAEEPDWGLRHTAAGIQSLSRQEHGSGKVRVLLSEAVPTVAGDPDLDDLRRALIVTYGTDYGAHSPTWISRFTDMARQAAAYRKGRVLLAGDAAHVHHPVGGQGLNTGLQDAVNLGWKLGLVAKGAAPDSLLDSYHAERHPVGARVLRNTLAQVLLLRPLDAHLAALREVLEQLFAMDEPRRTFAGMMSGLDIHYDMGEGHPLLGRRVPDLDLGTIAGRSRIFDLLHTARPVLLQTSGAPLPLGPWADRVDLVAAEVQGTWMLPALGEVAAPAAVLIRPDGYVAWVGDGSAGGLTEALGRWFGSA